MDRPARVIVLVLDSDNPARGDISVLDDPAHAAELVEGLLEQGADQALIHVFNGSEVEMQVRHRPVVTLVGPAAATAGPAQPEHPAQEPAAAPDEPEANAAAADTQKEGEEPYVQNGVRFSSLFKNAW